MQIDSNYNIEFDSNNATLQKINIVKEGKRKGETSYRDIGYYPKLSSCLNVYVINLINDEQPKNVEEMMSLLRVIENKIDDIGELMANERRK